MSLVEHHDKVVARPLKVLIPLIQQDIEEGDHAAETASMPYYKAAGEKLIEAKSQMKRGDWEPWVKRNFNVTSRTASLYMSYAHSTINTQIGSRQPTSLRDFQRQQSPDAKSYQEQTVRPIFPPTTNQQIKETLKQVDVEFLNTRRDEIKRADERDAQRQLALQLIDIGYKALASKLHPDKGGSREAMSRLNSVRDRLKGAV